MDQLYEDLVSFMQKMMTFNQLIADRWDALNIAFDAADKVWSEGSDTTRRQFNSNWNELGKALEIYRRQDSEEYLSFLQKRKEALDEYFGY
jgi:hypothetical protein